MASSSSCLVGRVVEQHSSHTAHTKEPCSMLEQDEEEQQGLWDRSGGQPWPSPPQGHTTQHRTLHEAVAARDKGHP